MFEKLHARFQNVFRPQENETPAFGNSSGLKKPTFCNGLKWTEGLIGETLLCFQVRTGPCLTIIHIGYPYFILTGTYNASFVSTCATVQAI